MILVGPAVNMDAGELQHQPWYALSESGTT
jgi:hypothetical protein